MVYKYKLIMYLLMPLSKSPETLRYTLRLMTHIMRKVFINTRTFFFTPYKSLTKTFSSNIWLCNPLISNCQILNRFYMAFLFPSFFLFHSFDDLLHWSLTLTEISGFFFSLKVWNDVSVSNIYVFYLLIFVETCYYK